MRSSITEGQTQPISAVCNAWGKTWLNPVVHTTAADGAGVPRKCTTLPSRVRPRNPPAAPRLLPRHAPQAFTSRAASATNSSRPAACPCCAAAAMATPLWLSAAMRIQAARGLHREPAPFAIPMRRLRFRGPKWRTTCAGESQPRRVNVNSVNNCASVGQPVSPCARVCMQGCVLHLVVIRWRKVTMCTGCICVTFSRPNSSVR